MALKDKWVDKINGVDINSADDINQVAHAVMELEKNSDVIIDKIIDPDNNPLSDSTETIVNFVMETGTLNSSTGAETESSQHIRSDFVSLSSSSGAIYASTEFKEDLRIIGYDENKAFVEKKYVAVGREFSIPEKWAYLRFYTGATDAQFTFVYGTPETKAEFKKIFFADHGYSIYGAPIDDKTMHKLVIASSGKDDNEYAILELSAPKKSASESTICLMNKDEEVLQFVDFSSMVYHPDDPTVEIVCQTRGDRKLPEFSVRFNDGKGAGRVKKLAVMPDCIPIKLTNAGIEVRRNNNYNNNATAEELVTVNLADLYDKVNVIYDALIANGTITE